jgi:predicted nucleic acid-binding protein
VIVVDTSVWIDVLNEVESERAGRCADLIRDGAPVALTDVVLTEVLQGLRTDREAQLVEARLRAFPILRLQALEDFALAAYLYRTARRRGVTIRRTLDCLIAAVCVRENAPILHADTDFDRLAGCTALRVFA